MRELTEKLPKFLPGKEPQYQTEAISFYTTFYNLNWGQNGRIPIEEVANRVNSTLEKNSIDEESSVKTFGDLQNSSVKQKLEKPNKFDPFGQKELTLLATI